MFIDLLEEEMNRLQSSLDNTIDRAGPMGLMVNIANTKAMAFVQQGCTDSATVKRMQNQTGKRN